MRCPRCEGKGRVEMMLRALPYKGFTGGDILHIIPCPQPGCHKGELDRDEYYRIVWGIGGCNCPEEDNCRFKNKDKEY